MAKTEELLLTDEEVLEWAIEAKNIRREDIPNKDNLPPSWHREAQLAKVSAHYEAEIKEMFEVYDNYLNLLGEELNELVPLAHVHGWKTHRYELGVECRRKIDELKSKHLGGTK